MPFDVRTGIIQSAQALGMSPVDLATIISYETGGTFNPTVQGASGHRGLIQFGQPEAAQYGVNWNDPVGSQLGPNGAIVRYFRDRGYKPGMSLTDTYSIVNAGGPGRASAREAPGSGGAPGTVADKVASMGPHRQKAAAMVGGEAPVAFGGKSSAGGPGGGTATGEAPTAANTIPAEPTPPTPPEPPDYSAYNAAAAQQARDPFTQLASTLASSVAPPSASAAQMSPPDSGGGIMPAPEFASAAPPPAIGHRPWDPLPEISIAPDTSQLADLFKVREDTGQARAAPVDAQGQPIIRRMRG